MKSSFCNISLRQNKPSILKCWYGLNWFRCFKLITGRFHPPFFPTRNTLLKNSSFKWLGLAYGSLLQMLSISTCTWYLWSRLMWGGEEFLEFFVGLGSFWKVFCIFPQVLKLPNPLSVFSMSPQSVLIFSQVAILEPLFQKIIFLSMDECFLIRSLELRVEKTCWTRFPFCLFLPCPLLSLSCWHPPKLCCCIAVPELFFSGRIFAALKSFSSVILAGHI